MAGGPSGLLAGVRVLDLTIWRPGPYCTQLLVEMGADVVKVEPPDGDPMRVFPELFASLNAGKRSVALDLKRDDERAAALGLARDADVVVEGFRPGVVDRLGIDPARVREHNLRVVYCSISGYGQRGPLAQAPGHDVNYQAWAGTLEPRGPGDEPVVARPPIADLAGGAYAAMAICAALVRRSSTGEGEVIDVAMTDILASWTGATPPVQLPDGREIGGRVAGYGTFRTADGSWIALGVISEDHFWAALTTVLGMDDVTALGFDQRAIDADRLDDRLAAAIARRPRDELVRELLEAGVPASPVLSQDEMLATEELRRRGTVVEHAGGGPRVAHPVRYERAPASAPRTVPELVAGTDAVPAWPPRP
jgi:crotonobetainyl-CoA:carnitine CoA-transferase CaiB-like acyl-CoA transferase